MLVKELIEELSKCDPESELIMQKDSEGNGYSPLNGIDKDCYYIPDSSWSGDVYCKEWTAEENGLEEDEWEEIKKQRSCIVLFPIN